MRSFPANSFVMVLLVLVSACIEPYDPPVSDEDVKILVVDGFLNASNGMAEVLLTRTIPVESGQPIPPESGAFVSVEDDEGIMTILTETGDGIYTGLVPGTNPQKRYRLVIRTSDTNEYASELISVQTTPPIDSIGYYAAPDGLELRVNTHDVTGKLRYFKWTFEETFQYHANFNSIFMFEGGEVVTRPFNQSLFDCWLTSGSTDILVGSTEHLNESVVSDFPIYFIPKGSIKLSIKYTLLVRQQALSQDEYTYWLNLQKSTEQVGGLFDPLPSEVSGNIHSTTNPAEKVIGFFSGGTVQESRIFITPQDLPNHLISYVFNPTCELDTVPLTNLGEYRPNDLLVDAVYGEFGEGLIGYTSSRDECVDCRLHGGTTTKPDFWK